MAKRKKPVVLAQPKKIELIYQNKINKWIIEINKLVRRQLIPLLPELIRIGNFELKGDSAHVRMDNRRGIDAFFSDLDFFTQQTFGQDWQETIAFEGAEQTNTFNSAKNRSSTKRVLGVDLLASEPWLESRIAAFTSDNVDLITSLQREHLRKIKQQVIQNVEKGMTNAEFAKNIEREFGKSLSKVTNNTKARAKLIARDQISKFNGKLTETRQRNAGFKKYRWITSLDERVRDNHRTKHGKVFSWDNPPADTGHPGEDYNCRCYAEPIMTADVNPDVSLRRQFNRR